MIVEDEMIVASDLRSKLEELGYSVCAIATSGEEAILASERHQPDLVLMDIQLAGACDGIEASRQIQEQFDIPTVYLTAHSDEATLKRAKATAPFGYILKPFQDSHLTTQIEIALIKHEKERQIREQQEWLRVTLKSIADAVIASDGEGQILFMNHSAEILTGWQEEEARGKPIKDIYRLVENKDRKGAGKLSEPFLLESKSGRKIPVEHAVSPIRSTLGQVIGVVITFEDISDRLVAEEQLEHNRYLLARSQAMAHLGSWEHNVGSGNIDWSSETFRIFGREPGSVKPSYGLFLESVHPEDHEYVKKKYAKALAEKSSEYDIEHRIIRPDGTIRHIHQRCEHELDENGEVLRAVGMVHDITERKLVEERLQRSNRELEQFASVASHDLQSPLVSLKGFLQLLESRYGDRLDAKGRDFISRSLNSVSRLQELIRDLLTFSRLTVLESTPEPADLDALAREVLEAMQAQIDARGAEVSLQPLPAVPVWPDQFKRLLQNLIVNGIKYNTSTPPKVNVRCREQPAQYHFSVEDNGIGIEPKDHDRIFELFRRLHSEAEYQGTGMGLAICKKVVEHHGGTLWVESRPSQGSVFHFTLPRS